MKYLLMITCYTSGDNKYPNDWENTSKAFAFVEITRFNQSQNRYLSTPLERSL